MPKGSRKRPRTSRGGGKRAEKSFGISHVYNRDEGAFLWTKVEILEHMSYGRFRVKEAETDPDTEELVEEAENAGIDVASDSELGFHVVKQVFPYPSPPDKIRAGDQVLAQYDVDESHLEDEGSPNWTIVFYKAVVSDVVLSKKMCYLMYRDDEDKVKPVPFSRIISRNISRVVNPLTFEEEKSGQSNEDVSDVQEEVNETNVEEVEETVKEDEPENKKQRVDPVPEKADVIETVEDEQKEAKWIGKVRFAVVCSSNVNRSMEAHARLLEHNHSVCSYGTGKRVKLPGTSAGEAHVFPFGTPFTDIAAKLSSIDIGSYTRNGVLEMLRRDAGVKNAPERFQDVIAKGSQFDIVFAFENRVFDHVCVTLHEKETQSFSTVHVVNLHAKDSRESAEIAANICLEFADNLCSQEDWEDSMDSVIRDTESKHGVSLLHTVIFA